VTAPDRSPPHSLPAEKSVLGSVLIKPAVFDDVAADLAVDDFFLPAHREVFDAMLALTKRKRAIDMVGLSDELLARGMLSRLEGGDLYLSELANSTPTAENVSHYVRTVREKATLRRLIATCGEIQSRAYGADDVEGLLEEARAKVVAIDVSDVRSGPTVIGDTVQATLDSIETRSHAPADFFLPTGYREFDEQIGGIRGGNLVTIAARPGKGKSAMLLDILLHNAERGIPVLLFSYEMTKMEIVERALANRSSVDGRSVVSGYLKGPEWVAITSAASKLSTLPFWLVDESLPFERLMTVARRWAASQRVTGDAAGKRKLAAIGVDYLGLMELKARQENRAAEISIMTRGLKKLASDLKVPVIEAAQLNRENEKTGGMPMLSHLRDSGSIEQDSNMVLFPWTDDAAHEAGKAADWWPGELPPYGQQPALIIVGKNRGGPVGRVPVIWESRYVRFRDRADYSREPVQEDLL
jgi:replicative DNA helicase